MRPQIDSQIFVKSILIAAFLIGVIAIAAAFMRPGASSGLAQGGNSNTGWIQNWSRNGDDDD